MGGCNNDDDTRDYLGAMTARKIKNDQIQSNGFKK
jgi:hypothetical protein